MGALVGQEAGTVSNELLGHYLNDHLAGAVAGCDLAEQIEAAHVGTPLGGAMSDLSPTSGPTVSLSKR